MAQQAKPLLKTAFPIIAACALVWPSSADAEVFELSSGAQVQGELLETADVPKGSRRIRLSSGIEVTLARADVVDIIRPRPEELEYARIRTKYPDTVEGQWELAEWCRKARLSDLREGHLRRILELDPNHEPSRRALGYTHRGGKWTRMEDEMAKLGYVSYKGRWMLPEQVMLEESEAKTKAAEGEWQKKFKRWRDWLGTDKSREAEREMMKVTDPYAIAAVRTALAEEPNDRWRILFLRVLANIDVPAARTTIAQWSMEERSGEVRLTCFDLLRGDRAAMEYYVGFLTSKSNPEVNQAAVALKHMGDRAAVGPLIHALRTTHQFLVTTGQQGSGGASFSDKGVSMNQGASTQLVEKVYSNAPVLEALVTLADGPNFGYDEAAWHAWWTTRNRVQGWDPRRG